MTRGSGILDRRVQLYAYQLARTARGGEAPIYTYRRAVWAQYMPVYGKSTEKLEAAEISGLTYATFLIRFRDDVSVKDQIWFQPTKYSPIRKFDIQSVDIAGAGNEYLQLLGLERQTA